MTLLDIIVLVPFDEPLTVPNHYPKKSGALYNKALESWPLD